MIEVYCYSNETFSTRTSARRFYRECLRNSEGAEHNRYQNVLDDLESGFNICWDQITILPKEIETEYNKQF